MADHPALTAIHEAIISYLHSTGTNTSSAQELEVAVDTLLSTVHRAVAESVSKWNARTDDVWRRLPTELYAECFRHLEMTDRIAVTHTSRLWRKNALSIPSLWSTIHSTGTPKLDTTLVQTMLRRSASAPLSLTLFADIADDPTTLDQLRQNIHRVKSLAIKDSCGSHLLDALLPPPQTPLPRLETLELSDDDHWSDPEKSLSNLFPCLRSLHITESFEGLFHPMPHLQELSCIFALNTDGRRIFQLCPNLRKFAISPVSGRINVKMLPQGCPPASLQKFKLDSEYNYMIKTTPFLKAWVGHQGLRSIKLIGSGDQPGAAVALFSSIFSDPKKMVIDGSDYFMERGISIRICDDTPVHFEVHGEATNEMLLDIFTDGAHRLSNLNFLHIPGYLFEDMLVNGTVTLPAVTHMRIDLESSDMGTGWYGSCIHRLLALDLDALGGLRAPCLQYFTFGTSDHRTLLKVFDFARQLRKAIQFDAPRLSYLIFSGVSPDIILSCQPVVRTGNPAILELYDAGVALELGCMEWSRSDWSVYDRIVRIQIERIPRWSESQW